MISEPRLFGISDACSLSGVSPGTLRRYEQEGVIGPIERDSRGVRLYTLANIAAAKRKYNERIERHGRTGRRRLMLPREPFNEEAEVTT